MVSAMRRIVASGANRSDLTRPSTLLALGLLVLATGATTTFLAFSASTIERVSVGPGQELGNGPSFSPSAVSANGRYVAFMSDGSNLVTGDTNNRSDVFVRDRNSQTTERVSVASNGTQGDNHVPRMAPSLSDDGTFVAFASGASNLVTNDTNLDLDVFVHDRTSDSTERVSVTSAGVEGASGRPNYFPSISADGRHVAFWSYAYNLAPGGDTDAADVYVHDRVTRVTERVSLTLTGTSGGMFGGLTATPGSITPSRAPSISGDGRFVTFWTNTANLVSGVTSGPIHVYVFDRQTRVTELISKATGGAPGNGGSFKSVISVNGRYVAFESGATNLTTGDTNGHDDIFVHDRSTGTTTRVSVGPNGAQGNNASILAAISSTGQLVGFQSLADNLVTGDANNHWDIFLHDLSSGVTERVAESALEGSVSGDGRYVAFESDLIGGASGDNADGGSHVYVADRGAPAPTVNLALNITDEPDPARVNQDVTYSLRTSNVGTAPATNVMLVVTVPAGLTVNSITASQGTCTQASTTVTCSLGSIQGGANALVTLVARASAEGTYLIQAQVAATERPTPVGAQEGTTVATMNNLARLNVGVQGLGTVSSNPAGIACHPTCVTFFAPGTPVTLTATPNAGWVFIGWEGACQGSGACSVTLTGDTSVRARFTRQ